MPFMIFCGHWGLGKTNQIPRTPWLARRFDVTLPSKAPGSGFCHYKVNEIVALSATLQRAFSPTTGSAGG